PTPEILQIGDITIDVAGHSVKRGDQTINLTPLEFDLLVALARKPRQVFTREVLLEQVWGYRHAADTRLVNVHVQRLRAKIEKDPEHPEIVVTVRGVGYKAGSPWRLMRTAAVTDSVQAPSPNAAAPALEGEAAFTRWQRMGNALRAGYVVTQRLARGLVTAVHSRWRRSLQLRVVTTTLMASVLVTAILGFFMVQQVRSDLLKAKEQAAFSDHHMGLTAALGILQDSGQQDPERQLDEIVEELSARSGATGLYDVVILPSVG